MSDQFFDTIYPKFNTLNKESHNCFIILMGNFRFRSAQVEVNKQLTHSLTHHDVLGQPNGTVVIVEA